MLRPHEINEFQALLKKYYTTHGRDLPWRLPESDGSFDPYKILVSEVMLQQTQVQRVIPKYQEFLTAYPSTEALSEASLQSVLSIWQGLGYGRRARYLREAARQIVQASTFPDDESSLVQLPGVGVSTARAVLVYAFNQPHVFIETNVRSVYLHHFFSGQQGVRDKQILELVEQTFDRDNPREFYWALMDYGTYIKQKFGNQNTRSRHYKTQSAFVGSERQLRGVVLKKLASGPLTLSALKTELDDDRSDKVIEGLLHDRLVCINDDTLIIAP